MNIVIDEIEAGIMIDTNLSVLSTENFIFTSN
jgi:hypothetical protein